MKVERSTNHTRYMRDIANRCNARRAELIASGMEPDQASRQAQAEIVTPELQRRRERRRLRVSDCRDCGSSPADSHASNCAKLAD